MYGPVSKDGPSMEFGEVGEEIDPFWSKENQKHLEVAAERLDSGKGEMHELIPLND